jgi:hypothetical protein
MPGLLPGIELCRGDMRFGRALWLLGGAALLGSAAIPVQAQSDCSYLTRPKAEAESGATRVNQWAEGTTLCFHSRVLRCEAAAWQDIGECPDGTEWQALDAASLEQNAEPSETATPAPATPSRLSAAPPTQTVVPEIAARRKEPDTTLMGTGDQTALPSKTEPPAGEGMAMPAPGAIPPAPADSGADSTQASEADCSDMQRLSFERVFNKSIAETQRCQAACANDACKQECESQHENIRAPQIMERFHAAACRSSWYP